MSDDSEKTLRDRGALFLCGKIDTATVRSTAIDLLQIDNEDASYDNGYDHINMIINSPGGSCWAGFMLIDVMGLCSLPIHTTGLGVCASMGFMILCSGTKGHRKITDNTTLLCHQFSWYAEGKRHELVSKRKEEEYQHERFVKHLVKHTKLDRKRVEKLLLPESDVWLLPEEAVEYGIVDEIIRTDLRKRK